MSSDIDAVTLGPGLVVQEQSIGVAKTSTGIRDVDGMVGQAHCFR